MSYRQRKQQHHALHPEYTAGWHRPRLETAMALWERIAPELNVDLNALLPPLPFDLSAQEHEEVSLVVKQALVVSVDAAVATGEANRMLTTNTVFDAVGAQWSENYREATEMALAFSSWQMRDVRIRASWRDLMRNGIWLERLLPVIHRGAAGLYRTERIPGRGYTVRFPSRAPLLNAFRDILEPESHHWRHRRKPRLWIEGDAPPLDLEQHGDADGDSMNSLDDEFLAELRGETTSGVVAEWRYNVVELGLGSIELIRLLEQARLFVPVATVLKEIDRLKDLVETLPHRMSQEYGVDITKSDVVPRLREAMLIVDKATGEDRVVRRWSPRERELRKIRHDATACALVDEYDAARGHLSALAAIERQLKTATPDADGYIKIRSAFRKLVNRRYQSVHFWPTEITGKALQNDLLDEAEPDSELQDGAVQVGRRALYAKTSRRGRWFSAAATGIEFQDRYRGFVDDWAGDHRPLFGIDVSSSLVQVQAVFLGLRDLEARASRQPFKEMLATRAWQRHQDAGDPFILSGFDGPDDPKLREAVKVATMTILYGSDPQRSPASFESRPTDMAPG